MIAIQDRSIQHRSKQCA